MAAHTLASSNSGPRSPKQLRAPQLCSQIPSPETNPFRADARAQKEAFTRLSLQKSSQNDVHQTTHVLQENVFAQLRQASPPKDKRRTRGTTDSGGNGRGAQIAISSSFQSKALACSPRGADGARHVPSSDTVTKHLSPTQIDQCNSEESLQSHIGMPQPQ